MTSSWAEIEKAILDAIAEDTELRASLEAVPDKVAATVASLVPVDTGKAKASIEVKARRSPYKRLSPRRIKIGEVYSDDDPAKINTIEYGRSESDNNGSTPEFAPFRRGAAAFDAVDI